MAAGESQPYNPLDKLNLGKSVTDQLLSKLPSPLPPTDAIEGAGIYAIYYTGDLAEYADIAAANRLNKYKRPIYVGKAIPPGGRMGAGGLESNTGFALWNRLKEHAESIRQAQNLNIEDFTCRYLTVDDIWIPLAETLLIGAYRPVWNSIITGFGNHDPGGGRYNQKRSLWDEVHPGRTWAQKCQPAALTADEIWARLRDHTEVHTPET